MADKVAAGHVGGANGAREAVCIHTKKIYSSCRDKDLSLIHISEPTRPY